MSEVPKLYTQEYVVLGSKLARVDLTVPINVYIDIEGNEALADGNHRSFRAYQEGKLETLPRRKIGPLPKDVSKDPHYRPISELRIIDNK